MRLPVYERRGETTVAPAAVRSPSAPSGAFGGSTAAALGGVGNALTDAGNEMLKVVLDMQAKADDAAVLEASNRWSESVNGFLNDPEKGLYNRRFAAAKGATTDATKAFDDIEKDLTKKLENDRQRDLFRRFVMQNRTARLEGVSKHEREEFMKYREQTTNDAVSTALSSIAASYSDDSVFEVELKRAENALLTMLDDYGEEIVGAKVKALRSAAHEARLERWLVDDPKSAQAYWKANKDAVDGSRHAQWAEKVEKSVMVEWVQETADDLSRKFSSEVSALKYVREHYSGDKENSLVTALKTRFSEKKAAQAEHRAATADALDNLFYNAPDETTLVREMQRRGYSEGKIRAYRRQYRRNRTEDMYDEATSLPWEVGAQELRNIAEEYGASPAEAERLVSTHESIREAQLGRIADASETIEDLGRMLDSIGVSPSERKKAMGYYVAANEPELKRQAEIQSATAANSVWDEIQSGAYDAGKMGVEGKSMLIERLGELPLTKQQSDALLKAHSNRFSVSKHAHDDTINAAIKAEAKKIKDPVRAAKFIEAATETAARMPEGTPLPQIVEAVGELRKQEVLIEKRPGIWPNVRVPAYEAPPAWEGWVFSEKLGYYVRPSGKKDAEGRDILEKWVSQ